MPICGKNRAMISSLRFAAAFVLIAMLGVIVLSKKFEGLEDVK